ncbi:hypothetical protein BO94DRAFT_582798 [Aspergillus sclerotioniger CBS 115572]|uniref:Uncharacterized protein n=1 Tax=Aspergillus sclerotioniger CBS 115572 TaxID=1450535 RepID=A0A317X455_9EURO|nr:hypothetical protein BO94DRAFT_582798 [Aspergillus sclerotioniger CBS 115572]PWY93414.1 hypothetical protein BO94DRAFT_582798 [Aspergillus sclerotioniger CBS 115572]
MATPNLPPERKILSKLIDVHGYSHYRLQIDTVIKYLSLKCGTFDEPTLGELKVGFFCFCLPRVEPDETWHEYNIPWLDLTHVEKLSENTFEVTYLPKPTAKPRRAIAKFYPFGRDENLYRQIQLYEELQGTGIAPEYLGNIIEGARVIGFHLEKVEGREASVEDLPARRAVLQRFHKKLDRAHGDVHRRHSIVQKKGVKLISFGKSECCDGAKDQRALEVSSLEGLLAVE